ncbi:hypothetical protein V9T40_003631 [Parthenolecanium corni]|uniref:Uncharacterized protein n=1 Tax=Parthenolecanium corni TaxID=536013 RepID=A0AAN9YAA8_9HEMI
MDIKVGAGKLILVLLSLGLVQAENWARLRSINGDCESAKGLKWIAENDTASLEYAAVGFSDKIQDGEEVKLHICRVRLSAREKWLSGTLLPNRFCRIVTDRYVIKTDNNEVLHHVNGASHLLWKDWDVDSEIPAGVVYVDDKMMIARKKNKGSSRTYGIGYVNLLQSPRIIILTEDHELEYIKAGEVLVEIKPKLYDVFVFDTLEIGRENSMNETVKLGEIILRNVLQRATKVESIIPFQWLHRSKWTDEWPNAKILSEKLIPGTDWKIHDLSVDDNIKYEILKWDTLKEEIKYGNYSVFTDLEAETEVQVTLQAKLVEKKDFFKGTVKIYYEGGDYHMFDVPIVHQQTALNDFEVVYGQKFNLNKNFTTTNTDSLTITDSSTPVTSFTTTTIDSSTLNTSVNTTATDSLSPKTGSTITTRDSSTLEISSPTITTDSSTPETSSITSTTDSSTLDTSFNTTTTDSSTPETGSTITTRESSTLEISSPTITTVSSTPETSSIKSTTDSSTLDTSSNTTTKDSSSPETGSTITTRDSSTLEISSPTITTDSSTPETSSITSTTDSSTLDTSFNTTTTDSSTPETGSTITTRDSSTLEISSPTITTDSSTPETSSITSTTDSSTLDTSFNTTTTDSSTPETSSTITTRDSSTLEISSPTITTVSSTQETSSITSTTDSSTLDTSFNTTTTDSSTSETSSTITTRDFNPRDQLPYNHYRLFNPRDQLYYIHH